MPPLRLLIRDTDGEGSEGIVRLLLRFRAACPQFHRAIP